MSTSETNFDAATAILATLLLDDRQIYDQNTSQRVALKKTLLSHGGIAPQIQKYFKRLETRNYRVTSVVDDTHSPPTDKRLVLVPEKGPGRDSGIEDGRQSIVSSVVEHHHFMRTVLTHKEFSVYKHTLLCAQYPVLGRSSRPGSQASTASSHHHHGNSFLLSPHAISSSSPYSFRLESEDEDEDTDYPIQTETLSAVVRGAFQLTEERHLYYDKNINEGLGWKAPAKVLVEELVSRLALLERNKHPFYQPQSFDTRNAYDFWQQQDRIRISELINKFWYFALPSPASSLCKPSYWESMHEEYTDLMHKLIRYDKSQAMSSGSLLSSASRRLLKEFGLRYGVGELYRRIVYLVYLAEKDHFDSELLYIEHVCKQLAGLRDLLMNQQARFTMVRLEFDLLCETLNKLHNHCGEWLQRLLQDTHSPDRVGSLAKLLCNVLELWVNLTGKKQTPVEDFMQQYLQESLKQAYNSQKLRLTTELNLNAYTSPVSAEMVNKLIISIRDEVTRCTQCYNEVFSRFNLDVGELAIVTLYDVLMVDVMLVCQLAAEQEQDMSHIDQDLLALAYRLSQLDQEWNSYILPHAQQWRQPLMAQTRLWLSHLTRDLTTMVLNSTNSDMFTTIALPLESARVLPNPPSMTPNLSHRICQSPWSAFSSFHTKDQQQVEQDQQHQQDQQQHDQQEEQQKEQDIVAVTSSASPVASPELTHRPQEVKIQADIHIEPQPEPSTNMQRHSPAVPNILSQDQANKTSSGPTQEQEVLPPSNLTQTTQDVNREISLLKTELLQERESKIRRCLSAPDLNWTGEDSTLETSYEASGKLTQSESVRKCDRPSRPNVHAFTSSGDSGLEKDRYSSQEDFEHAPAQFGSGDSKRLHRKNSSKDDKPGKDGDDVASGGSGDEMKGHFDGTSGDIIDELNNNSKDLSKSFEDDQCVELESSSDTKQIISCDVTCGASLDDLLSADQQESANDSRTKDLSNLQQDIDTMPIQSTESDGKREPKSTTHTFQPLPTSEQPGSWLDRELLRTGISPVNEDDIIVSRIEDDSSLQVSDSKIESIAPDVSRDKDADPILASDIVEATLSHSNAAYTGNSVECQTDTSLVAKEVKSHSHMTDSLLETIPEYNSDEQTEARADSNSESSVPNSSLPHEPCVPNSSLHQAASNQATVNSINESSVAKSSLRHAASDLAWHIPNSEDTSNGQFLQGPAVRPKFHRPSRPQPRIATIDDVTAQQQLPPAQPTTSPLCISPSLHSTPVQQLRFRPATTIQSLEDSITASLSDLSEEGDHPYLAVSCSVVDVLVMVQQMVSFVSELCLILCPMPGSLPLEDMDIDMDIGPSGESYSALLCQDRAKRMRGELLNSITQTMANTLGLYVQNILAIDACATPHPDATKLLTRQINEDLEERKRLVQLGRCRHDRAGTSCNMYLFKEAAFLCDQFEPITHEMCVRINNTWSLSCLVPHFQGLLPKDLLQEGPDDDLTFDLTPHSDPQYIAAVMESQIKLLAHKLNLFLAQGLEVLMSNEMPGCCMAVRLGPITECLTNHLAALKQWLYPKCYQLFNDALWQLIIMNFERQVERLVRYNEEADQQALLLLQGLTHLIEYLHNAGQGLSIDDLVEPAEPVLQLLQLFTLQTKRLIQLHKKLFKEKADLESKREPLSGGLTDVMPREKLYKMFHELHKKRKCFTGLRFIEWIQDNCIDEDDVVVNSSEQAADIAEKLLDIGVISPITRTGDTPNIKPGELQPSNRSQASHSQSEGGTDIEFPPVTIHSITNSGYWLGSDTSDSEAYRPGSHRHPGHPASPRRLGSPYAASPAGTISRSSSASSLCIFRADNKHFYCFTDIDDEVFYGVGTRMQSPTPSSLSGQSVDADMLSFYDDKHLKLMSVRPEFVLGIIYARRRKCQEAARYVQGLPASVVSGIERSLPSFWFCLSVCNGT